MSDDILDEVRRVRKAYGERFGFDLAAICRDLREQDRLSGRRTVSYVADRAKTSSDDPDGGVSATDLSVPVARGS